jgi:phage tail sheath protein FI
MPVTPTYPGVYIEEVPSGVHTITGVATSIAAFFGRTARGPFNKAKRCFSYSDFTRYFGGPHEQSDLAQSVRHFFDNGGTECYIVRLANDPKQASVTLKSLQEANVLVATAKAAGKWGNLVRLEVNYNTDNPDETFNLYTISGDPNSGIKKEEFKALSMNPNSPRFAPTFVTQGSELINLELHEDLGNPKSSTSFYNTIENSFAGFSQARCPLSDNIDAVKSTLTKLINTDEKHNFKINVDDTKFVNIDLRTLNFPDDNADVDGIASEITRIINKEIQREDPDLEVQCLIKSKNIGHVLTIKSTGVNKLKCSVRIKRGVSNDIAEALMLGVEQGGIEPTRWSNFRPVPTASFINYLDYSSITEDAGTDDDGTEVAGIEDTQLDAIANMNQGTFNKLEIDGTEINLAEIVTGTATVDLWILDADGGNDGVREKLKIIVKAINKAGDIPYRAELWGYHLALLAKKGDINTTPAVSTLPAPGNPEDFKFEDIITTNVYRYTLGTGSTGDFTVVGAIGDDGDAPTKSNYVGDKDKQTGFHALDVVDTFNLMVLPYDEDVKLFDMWGPASYYCEKKRAFLLIDAPGDWTNPSTGLAQVVQDTKVVGNLRAAVANKNSAVFYPRLVYKKNGLKKKIGPAGAIAGLMARTDAARGIWKAPAGTEADIRGILGLEVKLTDMENGVLNKLAVNCLREFPGSYVCWGSRTMDGYDANTMADWKYIPVRRLALFIEESLFRGTKWVVFEPNDEPLWAKIRLNVGAFMMRLFKQGAFQGSTPDKAFYVRCDSETTPQADINLGIVNIEVGFAPLKPAEFVIIKIQQMAGELK